MAAESLGDEYDAIIIGCGMAGLALGIRLATFEQRVLILEKHNAPGGLNSFYFQQGRKFDVGLHAVTNFSGPADRRTPLKKLLRQLRLSPESFPLYRQNGSRIAFGGADLRFSNEFGLLESEVARVFPGQVDGFRGLREAVLAYDALDLDKASPLARSVIRRHINEPMLEDMLLCPLMYYGSATEHDMDFAQFVTLWKSIYEEGFGRPLEGVRVLIRGLLDRYRELGGKRRMRCPVRRILVEDGCACGVELGDGTHLRAKAVFSTVGWPETQVLCGERREAEAVQAAVGKLSFTETISVLDRQPAELGWEETIVFFNEGERFEYAAATDPVDTRSGVICFPNNYAYPEGQGLDEGLFRVTSIADPRYWRMLEPERYAAEKAAWYPRIQDSARRFLKPVDDGVLAEATVAKDMFTPKTIEHYTAHFGGAVYGSPQKRRTGETPWGNLYLAGTDQGFLGIVGALLSGVSMANRHVLQPMARRGG